MKTVKENCWFKDAKRDAISSIVPLSADAISNITKRRASADIHRALMADMASHQNLAQMRDLNKLFVSLDTDNDGTVDVQEARTGLSGKLDPEMIEQLLRAISHTEPGGRTIVAYNEFMGQLMAGQAAEEGRLLADLFSEFDTDRSGFLSRAEIEAVLARPQVAKILVGRDASSVMREMDADGDGRIVFEEFRRALEGGSAAGVAGTGAFQRGDAVQYYSPSYSCWMDCTVTATDPSGAVQVSAKPGYWLRPAEQSTKLRRPTTGAMQPAAGIGRKLLGAAF